MRLFSVSEVSKMLNISPDTVRRRFKQWCEQEGCEYSQFLRWELREGTRRKYPTRVLYIPEDAIGWIGKASKMGRMPGNSFNLEEKMRAKVKNKGFPLKYIAEMYNVSIRKVRREFKWWCFFNNKNPREYWVPGLGYVAPREFLARFNQMVRRASNVGRG